MKKLRLEPDDLRVESFASTTTDGDRGTVQAHLITRSCPRPCTNEYTYCTPDNC